MSAKCCLDPRKNKTVSGQRSAAVFLFQPARRRRAEAKVKGRGGSEARKNVLRQARSRVHSVDEWTPGLRGQQQGGVHLRNMAFGPPLRSCHGSEGVGRQGGASTRPAPRGLVRPSVRALFGSQDGYIRMLNLLTCLGTPCVCMLNRSTFSGTSCVWEPRC